MSDSHTPEYKVACVKSVLNLAFTQSVEGFRAAPSADNYTTLTHAMLAHQATRNPGFAETAVNLYDNVRIADWGDSLANDALSRLNSSPTRHAISVGKRRAK